MSDPTKQFYDRHVDEYERKTKDLAPIKWMRKFMKEIPKGGDILDIGCGNGRDAKIFIDNGFHIVGIDYSLPMIQRARSNVPHADFLQMDMLSLKFPPETFDGVWSMTSLLHIPKTEISKVLDNIHQLLKPKGILFVGLKLGEGEGLEDDTRYENAKRFYSYYLQEEFVKLLHDLYFTIIEVQTRDPKIAYENRGMLELIAQKQERI